MSFREVTLDGQTASSLVIDIIALREQTLIAWGQEADLFGLQPEELILFGIGENVITALDFTVF